MSELDRNTGEFQLPNIHSFVTSRGIETKLTLSGNAIHTESSQGNIGLLLDKPEVLFVRTQVENPNKAFLSSELRLRNPVLQSFSCARLYSSLTSKFGPQITRDNFIA